MSDSCTLLVDFTRPYDVVVVGGGTTGVCAALAAARHGMRVAIVEANSYLGGMAAAGFPWNGFHNYQENRCIVKGIPLEIVSALQQNGHASKFHLDPVMESLVDVNGSMLKILLFDMVSKEGVDVYLRSTALKVEPSERHMQSVYIFNRQGCQKLLAKVIIDCTDSADVAQSAGACVHRGDAEGRCQASSLVFAVADIDMDALISYLECDPAKIRPRDFTPSELEYVIKSLRRSPLSCIGAFSNLIEKATRDGLDFPKRNLVSGTIYPNKRQMLLVTSKVVDVNPRDVDNYTRSEMEGYHQVQQILRFLREYVPGCSNARIIDISNQIGVRETVHITAEYCLTAEDLLNGRIFEDTVALGSYIMDIHSAVHAGVDPCVELPTYSIPYRSLVPQGIDGMLVAGRCIGATHEAMSGFRVIPITAAIGQGAGTAAAMAIAAKCKLRELDGLLLRQQLEKDGAETGMHCQASATAVL